MDRDEWDAPYTPALLGFLKLVGTALAVALLVGAVILARALLAPLLS